MVILPSLAVALLLVGQAPPRADTARIETSPAAKADTPETSLRAFLIAMMVRDEPGVRAHVLPDPDLDVLLKSSAPIPNAFQKTMIQQQLGQLPIRALRAGEVVEIPLPQGKQAMTIGPDDVSDTAAMLQLEGNPIPTRLRKVNGHWLVDARPIIAGRKAAEAARKKREEAAKP